MEVKSGEEPTFIYQSSLVGNGAEECGLTEAMATCCRIITKRKFIYQGIGCGEPPPKR